jgi:hypothetical protein
MGHRFVRHDRLHRVASDDEINRKVVLYLLILEVAASIYIFRVENTASPKTATRVSVGTSNLWLSNEFDMSAASKKQYMALERSSIHWARYRSSSTSFPLFQIGEAKVVTTYSRHIAILFHANGALSSGHTSIRFSFDVQCYCFLPTGEGNNLVYHCFGIVEIVFLAFRNIWYILRGRQILSPQRSGL